MTMNVFALPYDFLNNLFFSLTYFIVRTQCRVHITCWIWFNWLFMLSLRLLVYSRLLVVSFGGFSTMQGVSASNLHTVQGSAVLPKSHAVTFAICHWSHSLFFLDVDFISAWISGSEDDWGPPWELAAIRGMSLLFKGYGISIISIK